MEGKRETEDHKFGIGGLPQPWSIAVQLVGTFGLAVFLVLYYVFFMQPNEAARYEGLRKSVESLMHNVQTQQSLLTREQTSRLETLYVLAVAPEVVDRVIGGLEQNVSPGHLEREIEDILRVRATLLDGLTRNDSGKLSEMLTNKIQNENVALKIVRLAQERWRGLDRGQILEQCTQFLEVILKRAALAK